MLRINLLPLKAARRAQMGKRQLALMLSIIVVVVALMSLVHIVYVRQDTTDLSRKLSAVKDEIRSIKARTGDTDKYRRRKKRYNRRKKAFTQVLGGCYCRCGSDKNMTSCNRRCSGNERMQRFCPGPVLVMREMSRILSERHGPTLKTRLDPSRKSEYFNPNWDPTSLLVTKLEEQDRRMIITGQAKVTGDVAEFEKRLKHSMYFEDVRVEKTRLAASLAKEKEKVSYYEFEINAAALY